ncbi:MAG: glycosyltransferase family 2 protein [Chloroflexota bacterium]
MSHPDLSIIIPMYNEAQVIRRVLESLLEMLTTTLSHISFEIIVVDDGSSDDSAAQVLQLAHPAVHLQQHPYNIGNGAAVKTGIRHAQGAYILLMDADGQHKPEDVPRLLEHK